jgi:site-specific recombinase XerD
LLAVRPSWERSLRAKNRSATTIKGYLAALDVFRAYLIRAGTPLRLAAITTNECKGFIAEQLTTRKPNTAATRFRNLNQFWRWRADEGEIERSPMAGMKQPKVPDDPPPVLSLDDLSALLKVCRRNEFTACRHAAIIRLLFDCGMRRAEIAHLRLGDIDWQEGTLLVTGKGGRQRLCSFGKKAARDLDRYLRVRATHRHAETEWLWLGLSGKGPRLSDESIYRMIQRRAAQVGIGKAWVHLFRHTFAHLYLDAGGQEGQLVHLGGWRDYQTMMRCGRGAAAQRARAAHKLLSPGDRV